MSRLSDSFVNLKNLFGKSSEGVQKLKNLAEPMLSGIEQETLRQELHFLRQLGFYRAQRGLDLEQLFRFIEKTILQSGEELHSHPWIAASFDEGRFWRRPARVAIRPETATYATIIQEMAAISRDQFTPADIIESWSPDNAIVTAEYTFNRRRWKFQGTPSGGLIDPRLFALLNESLSPSSHRFEVILPVERTIQVCVLTEKDRQLLVPRGWKLLERAKA